MSAKTLSVLLHEAEQNIAKHLYPDSLRIIREAKIIDLHNIYLSAFEQFASVASHEQPSGEITPDRKQLLALLVTRAIGDNERRMSKRSEEYTLPDLHTLEQEKTKNLYFQRTDELLERKEYERALEEVRRIYVFDASNIVAKEYEHKIEQLIMLKDRNE